MSLFNEHFVKPGKVNVESGWFYSRMFEFRQKSDYTDFVSFEEEKVREWIEKAKQFYRRARENYPTKPESERPGFMPKGPTP